MPSKRPPQRPTRCCRPGRALLRPRAPELPELPEVETVRDGLARHVLGRTVLDVEVRRDASVRRQPGGAEVLVRELVGRRFTGAARRGKFLWLPLTEGPVDARGSTGAAGAAAEAGRGDDRPRALLAHLGMSGQLLVRRPGVVPEAGAATERGAARATLDARGSGPGGSGPGGDQHVRVRVVLGPDADPLVLDFVDQRTFGHLTVVDLVPTSDGRPGGQGTDQALVPAPAAHIARDPLDPAFDEDAVVARVRGRRTQIKRALLDQTLVSGVGNIYADEALWRARVHYARATDTMTARSVRLVLRHAADVMREALAAGGTSFDALYVNVNGSSGYFARSLDAYGRAGQPCRRCGTPLVREAFANRSSFRCPRCQRTPPAAHRR